MTQRNILASTPSDEGQQVEPHPTFLTLSPRTIRLGHGSEIFPIHNLTRIGKYKVLEARFPLIGIILLGIIGSTLLAVSAFYSSIPGAALGAFLLVCAAFGLWHRMRPKTFAFGFETNAGSVRYLYVKDEQFVGRIVEIVGKYIESEQNTGVIINVEDRSINNVGSIGGNAQTGNSK